MSFNRSRNVLLALSACLSFACATGLRGPEVQVEASALETTRAEACNLVAAREVGDHEEAALDAGMLLQDYEALRTATRQLGVTVTFRDSNPACLPHLAAGVQSKGHDIVEKTWEAHALPPDKQHLAGLVSHLRAKPPRGTVISDPQLTLKNGEPVTCDHDLMDVLDGSGRRVPGESAEDLRIRAALNAALPETPKGRRERVMHGAQAEYLRYHALHPEEGEPIPEIMNP